MRNNILARQQESCRKEIILATFLFVILFVKAPFEFFEIFIEHIFPAEFLPASKVVDSHVGQDAVPFEDPVYLLFLAPHHAPVIIIGLSPLASRQRLVHTVFEVCFEFDVGWMVRVVLFFDASTKIL